jgi:hypothetical protein
MRAGVKLMRWMVSRDAANSKTIDVDGIAVTEVHHENASFALANVGNRVLVTNDSSRMRAVLGSPAELKFDGLQALHEGVKLDGEDAWAFFSNTRLGGLSDPLVVSEAVASFDVTERDELAFRVAVTAGGTTDENRPFRATHDDCVTLVSTFLPVFKSEAIELDAEGAHAGAAGSTVFSGRIPVLSKYLPDLPKHLAVIAVTSTAKWRAEQAQHPPAPGTPSANPIPPSPPRPVGPRTGTPGGPTHEGTPKPPR